MNRASLAQLKHQEKSLESLPWHGQYPHLSLLILTSTNLPRELQECIGNSILATVKRYFYFLRSNAFLRKIEVIPAWSFYLSTKQKTRWHNASPRLHKAYSLIMALPAPVLHYMDRHAEGLVTMLTLQTLGNSVDLKESKDQIRRCLNLSNSLLMQLPSLPDEDNNPPPPEEMDAVDLLEESLVLQV